MGQSAPDLAHYSHEVWWLLGPESFWCDGAYWLPRAESARRLTSARGVVLEMLQALAAADPSTHPKGEHPVRAFTNEVLARWKGPPDPVGGGKAQYSSFPSYIISFTL